MKMMMMAHDHHRPYTNFIVIRSIIRCNVLMTIGGFNADFIMWEQSFNCGRDRGIFELIARNAYWYYYNPYLSIYLSSSFIIIHYCHYHHYPHLSIYLNIYLSIYLFIYHRYGAVIYYMASGGYIPSGCPKSKEQFPRIHEDWTPQQVKS